MTATSTEPLAPRRPIAIERRGDGVHLAGDLRLADGREIWCALRAAAAKMGRGERLDIDLTEATSIDGALAALLVAFRATVHELGGRSEVLGARESVRRLVQLHHGYAPPRPAPRPPRQGLVERLGDAVLALGRSSKTSIVLLGDLVLAMAGAITRPITANWRAVLSLAARAGAEGVPIVLLLDFLVGFVMGYQSARQLEIYGANVYVADVVGISVTRELGPLVTAIIVVGRSGAAFAAEIGTMKVSHELDALRTMGLSPPRYLVLPRIAALVIVTPALALLGDVVGVAGGAVVGTISLGVGPRAYAAELRNAVFAGDVVGGIVKSAVFGLAIAVIGCQQGLATTGGANGVGRRTTSTVVLCLFALVIIDAIFAVVLRVLGR